MWFGFELNLTLFFLANFVAETVIFFGLKAVNNKLGALFTITQTLTNRSFHLTVSVKIILILSNLFADI